MPRTPSNGRFVCGLLAILAACVTIPSLHFVAPAIAKGPPSQKLNLCVTFDDLVTDAIQSDVGEYCHNKKDHIRAGYNADGNDFTTNTSNKPGRLITFVLPGAPDPVTGETVYVSEKAFFKTKHWLTLEPLTRQDLLELDQEGASMPAALTIWFKNPEDPANGVWVEFLGIDSDPVTITRVGTGWEIVPQGGAIAEILFRRGGGQGSFDPYSLPVPFGMRLDPLE